MVLVYGGVDRRRAGEAVDLGAGRGDDALDAEVGAGLEEVERPLHVVGVDARVRGLTGIGPRAEVDDGVRLRAGEGLVDVAGAGEVKMDVPIRCGAAGADRSAPTTVWPESRSSCTT